MWPFYTLLANNTPIFRMVVHLQWKDFYCRDEGKLIDFADYFIQRPAHSQSRERGLIYLNGTTHESKGVEDQAIYQHKWEEK